MHRKGTAGALHTEWSWRVGGETVLACVRESRTVASNRHESSASSKNRAQTQGTRRSRRGDCRDGCGFTSTGCTAWLWMYCCHPYRGFCTHGTLSWWAFPLRIFASCIRWPILRWKRSTHRRGASEVGLWCFILFSTRPSTSGCRFWSEILTLWPSKWGWFLGLSW